MGKPRVEDCLNEFFVGLVGAAEAMRLRDEEREQRQAEWREKERIAREEARVRAQEAQRVKQLEADASAWRSATTIRSFVDAVEAEAVRRHADSNLPYDLSAWIEWARQHVKTLDPLTRDALDVHLLEEPKPRYW